MGIVLTGASGFVGARILQKYPCATVVPSTLTRSAGEELKSFIKEKNPRVIINASAISDIRECEKNPEASYVANVKLPVALAEIAEEAGAKLISFSSDQVYTGCKSGGPYREDEDLPTPANVYARHKLEGERRALDIHPKGVMLRATWMYDMPLYAHKNRGNFLLNVLGAIIRKEKMQFSDCAYRGITYVRQAVEFLDKVFYLKGGAYNYGSENPLSVYQTAGALFDALGIARLKEDLLEKIPYQEGEQTPHNLWINCEKLRGQGVNFDLTADGFARCINDYRINK